jgi:hypothetical protein
MGIPPFPHYGGYYWASLWTSVKIKKHPKVLNDMESVCFPGAIHEFRMVVELSRIELAPGFEEWIIFFSPRGQNVPLVKNMNNPPLAIIFARGVLYHVFEDGNGKCFVAVFFCAIQQDGKICANHNCSS